MNFPSTDYKFHPAANIFPLLADDELQALADDIDRNGQHDGVILLDNKIIDGRNRYRACRLKGIEPWYCELEKCDDPVEFVVSVNLHRRHLTESQRALVAARVKKHYEEQAKGRQKAAGGDKKSSPPQNVPVKENLPEPIKSNGQARDLAGAALKVSGKTVDAASKVIKQGSAELIKAVEQGVVSVSKAATIAKAPKAEQKQLLQESTKPKPSGKSKPKPKDKPDPKQSSGVVLPARATVSEVTEVERWLEGQDERPFFERFKTLWDAADEMGRAAIRAFVIDAA